MHARSITSLSDAALLENTDVRYVSIPSARPTAAPTLKGDPFVGGQSSAGGAGAGGAGAGGAGAGGAGAGAGSNQLESDAAAGLSNASWHTASLIDARTQSDPSRCTRDKRCRLAYRDGGNVLLGSAGRERLRQYVMAFGTCGQRGCRRPLARDEVENESRTLVSTARRLGEIFVGAIVRRLQSPFSPLPASAPPSPPLSSPALPYPPLSISPPPPRPIALSSPALPPVLSTPAANGIVVCISALGIGILLIFKHNLALRERGAAGYGVPREQLMPVIEPKRHDGFARE